MDLSLSFSENEVPDCDSDVESSPSEVLVQSRGVGRTVERWSIAELLEVC